MPIYEYRCNECEAIFSKMRSFSSADAPIDCDCCQSPETRRLLSRIAAVHRSGSDNDNGGTPHSAGGCAGCSSSNCGNCRH